MMKKTFKFLTLTVLLSMVGVLSAFAAEVTDLTFVKNGCTYKVIQIEWGVNGKNNSKGTVSVTGNPADQTQTSITIESSFQEQITGVYGGLERNDKVTFTVTEVLPNAFRGLNKVTSLTIPGTVTTIGEGAFANMIGLTYLKIGTATDKSDLTTLDNFAFGNDPIETLDLSDCPKLDLKSGRSLINAFGRENHRLKTVLLPKEIKEIGTAFAGLAALENLDLSKTKVSSLDEGALAGTSIKEVELARPTESTVAVISIGANALPETIEKLTVRGDLGPNAIAPQPGLTKLTAVQLFGALRGANAIPANVFPDSKLTTLAIGGREKDVNDPNFGILAAGAIAPDAFKGQDKLTYVSFNGAIVAGGIGHNAFEGIGECAKVVFRGELGGKSAIGKEAFVGASISELTFNKAIRAEGIAERAFAQLDCNAVVTFKGDLEEKAVGPRAFQEAELATVTFNNDIKASAAIRGTAFVDAVMTDLTFKGILKSTASIGGGAFENATISSITFEKAIDANGAIAKTAFKNFKSPVATGSPVTFNGNVNGNKAIAEDAFYGGAISELTIKGEISGTEAIAAGAFAENTLLSKIDLQNNIWAENGSAIAATAFQNSGIAEGAVLNAGLRIKTPAAIAAGAFAGANLSVVNFKDLLVEKAIADNQFAAVPRVDASLDAAKIKTVNFLNELKDWTKEQGASKNFVGNNAFTGTGVSTVNFVKVSTKDAIVVEDDSANPEMGPFAANGAKMTINFNGDVCTGGFGQYAFANSNTTKIVLNNDNEFSKLAFSSKSFLNIALEEGATPGNTKIVTIEYTNPAAGVGVYRAFDVEDFYETLTNVDIKFVTTADVKQMYSTDVNAEDMTPYRLKFFVAKEIKMNKIDDSHYYGFFDPEDEQYIIEKYQENGYDEETWQGPKSHTGAIVGVYSAYSDDQTLVQLQGINFPANFGGQPLYYADLYLNPLRVQEKGKYVLNQGHTFIITSNKPDPVVATQDDNNVRDGGVQTFAGLSPWACNDLRWNPARIGARYDAAGNKINGMFTEVADGEGCFEWSDANNKFEWAGLNEGNYAVKPGHEWDGEVSWMAIEDGDIDFYGNVVRNYQIFVSNPGSYGFEFANAPLIPAKSAYVLVGAYGNTDETKYSVQKQNRINYSGNNIYPTYGEDPTEELIAKLKQIVEAHNSETPEEGDYSGLTDWVNKVLDLAFMSGYGYRVDGDETTDHKSDDAHQAAIEEAFKALFGELQSKEVTDPETQQTTTLYFYDVYNAGTIKELFEKFKDLCDAKQEVAAAEQEVKDNDIINCYDPRSELGQQYLGRKFSESLEELEGEIEELEDGFNTEKLAARAETDDMYKQYLALKALGSDASNDALDAVVNIPQELGDIDVPSEFKKPLEEAAEEAEEIADLYQDYEDAMEDIVENSDDHAWAAFNNILWERKNHYTLTLWTANSIYGEKKGTVDVFLLNSDEYTSSWHDTPVRAFEVVKDQDGLAAGIYAAVGNSYGASEDNIIAAQQLLKWDSDQNEWVVFSNAPYASLITSPNEEIMDYVPKLFYKEQPNENSAFQALYPIEGDDVEDIEFDREKNILDLNPDELEGEALRCYNLLKSMQGLIAKGLVTPSEHTGTTYIYTGIYEDETPEMENMYEISTVDILVDAEEAKEDAEDARAAANNWLIRWYAQAVHYPTSNNSLTETYLMVAADVQAQEEIDAIQEVIDALKDLPCYVDYANAATRLETANTTEEEKDEALKTFIAGKYNEDVTALAEAISKVTEDLLQQSINAGARLNLIWNDRPEEVVGIMEAVVNKKAAAAVKGNAIYNLNGMRVNKAQKGIYIQNGQKVVVK